MPKPHDNHPNRRKSNELTYEERIPAAILRLLTMSNVTLHLQFDPAKTGSTMLGESWFLDADSPDGLRHMAIQASLERMASIFKVAWWTEGAFGKQGSYRIDFDRRTHAYASRNSVHSNPMSPSDQQQWWESGGILWLMMDGTPAFGANKAQAPDIERARLANDLEQGVANAKTTQSAQEHFNLHWGEATLGQPPLMLE